MRLESRAVLCVLVMGGWIWFVVENASGPLQGILVGGLMGLAILQCMSSFLCPGAES